MGLAKEVLSLPWLQAHYNKYLERILNKSKETIKLLKQGGNGPQSGNQDVTTETVQANHVNCYERYIPISVLKGDPYDSSLFQTIVDNNKIQGSAKCMKMIGLVTYAAHNGRDTVYLRCNKVCKHVY